MLDIIDMKADLFLLHQIAKENARKAFRLKNANLFLAAFCFLGYIGINIYTGTSFGAVDFRMSYFFFGMIGYSVSGIINFSIELFPNRLSKILYYLPMTQQEKENYFASYMKSKIVLTLFVEGIVFSLIQGMARMQLFPLILFGLTWVEITISEHMVISNYMQPEWYERLKVKDEIWKKHYGYAFLLIGTTTIEMLLCILFPFAAQGKGLWIAYSLSILVFLFNSIGSVLLIKNLYPYVVEMSTNYEATQMLEQTKRKR